MQRYATINSSGLLTGFYSTDVNSVIPAAAVELTEAQYQDWLLNQQTRQWSNGALVSYTPPPAALTPAQQAQALLLAGLTITSTSTPSLNGTYGASQQDEINVTALQVAVANNVFPGFYRDKSGTKHTMTSAQFTEIATAIMDFVVAVDEAEATATAGGTWTAPSNAATIP